MSFALRPRASALASLLQSAAGPPAARRPPEHANQRQALWGSVSQEIGDLLTSTGRTAGARQSPDGPRELRNKLLDHLEL